MDARLRGGLLALAAALAAGGARAQALPEGVTPEMVAQGKKLFEGRGLCSACHGPKARGAVGPNLTDAEWWHSDGSYPAIVHQILNGVPTGVSRSGTPMPPKGGSSLNDTEVRAVAAYVHSLRTVSNAGSEADGPGPVAAGAGGAGHQHQHRAGHAHGGGPGHGQGQGQHAMQGQGQGQAHGGGQHGGAGAGAERCPVAQAGQCPRSEGGRCPAREAGRDCPRQDAGQPGNGPCRT